MGKKGLFERLIRGFKKRSYRFSKPISRPYQPRKTYTVEEKLRILKELEETATPISVFAKWKGIAAITIQNWQNAYKTQGEKGLESKIRSLEQTLPAEVIDKIIKLKTENPGMGSPKISDWLARHDFIKVSANAILNLLKRRPETKELVAEAVEPKNPYEYKPKSFERSKPRQMYQMDITNWHLKSLYNVYIIGCIDDYSRYIVSWGVFRRQTSEHCIDVLRGAIEQFNSTPEEVLTDNGRQFYSWRGRNDFQRFLMKMGIKHIRSRPYHPQTLGKIESFWRNMYQELLSRETITSFEDLQAKMKAWIDQYNFKRPHQGIGGLVPADRFFGVEKQMREAMLEGAGMVKDALVVDPYKLTRPMYLIGRIGDKEIRVLAKDGSVIVQGVDSIEKHTTAPNTLQEPDQKVSLSAGDKAGELKDAKQREVPMSIGDKQSDRESDNTGREDSGNPIGLEQREDGQGDMPGIGDKQTDLLPVGEEDNRGDGEIVNPAEERAEEEGLDCSGETGERNPAIEERGQGITEEGEETETGERINQR